MDEPEIPLEGGNVTAGVVRVGDTVRRPLTPSSPLAHAVLRHLERAGFAHSPRLLGIDERGREILTFAPGSTIWPHQPQLLDSDEGLATGARLVAAFHSAMAAFPTPSGTNGSMVLHGDLAPWNIVVGDGRWTLIDWEAVTNGEPEWELAYVLHTFVPLWPDAAIADDDHEIVRRVRVFAEAYGATDDLIDRALRLAPERCRFLARMVADRAAAGEPAFARMLAEGHAAVWNTAADHIEARLSDWLLRGG